MPYCRVSFIRGIRVCSTREKGYSAYNAYIFSLKSPNICFTISLWTRLKCLLMYSLISRYVFRRKIFYIWPLHMIIGFGLIYAVTTTMAEALGDQSRFRKWMSFLSCSQKRLPTWRREISLIHFVIDSDSLTKWLWLAFDSVNSSGISMTFVSPRLRFQHIFIVSILLFLYDIFMVFITPLFTKNGDSVMVTVAQGASRSDCSLYT